ncbi:hypothetical protein BC332_26298 [Capsicum chinense]|nr:hypothetical protein BC332_26298 [Capsicum chinense]
MSSAVESMRQEIQLDMKRKLQEKHEQMAANLKRDMNQDLQKKLEEEREHMKGEVEKIFQEKMVALMAGMQQDNGGCSYFKWIPSYSEVSKFQDIAKFEMLKNLRDSEENRDLLMTLYRES